MTRLELCASGAPVSFLLRDYVDLCVAAEVFVDEVYALSDPGCPAVILDLGSHIGLSVLWFHARFPAAHIFAFEPDPASFKLLTRNTEALENVTVRNIAVGGAQRTAEFFSAEQSWLSSLLPSGSPERAGVTRVEVQPLPKILADLDLERVDVLKLDVEGAEWEILEAVALDRVADVVLGELHARGCPDGTPAAGLGRIGAFERVHVGQNDEHCCVFVARGVA